MEMFLRNIDQLKWIGECVSVHAINKNGWNRGYIYSYQRNNDGHVTYCIGQMIII